MYPKIKFIVDPRQDTENCKGFLNNNRGKSWLLSYIPDNLKYIVSPSFSLEEKFKIADAYTNSYFKIRKEEIARGTKTVGRDWKKVQRQYFIIVGQLFSGHPWPKGDYRGYASIFNMFPRDIKHKTFSFPYKHWIPGHATMTVAHEMLHFIFFDYVKKHYNLTQESKIKNRAPDYVWRVSEAFNTLIENWRPYTRIFGLKYCRRPYPECEKVYHEMRRQWGRVQDVNKLLDQIFRAK